MSAVQMIPYQPTYKTLTTSKMQQLTHAEFFQRLQRNEPTYEFTGDENNETNLYFDFDLSTDDAHDEDEKAAIWHEINSILKECIYEAYKVVPIFHVLEAFGESKGKNKASYHIHVPNIRDRKFSILYFVKKINEYVKINKKSELYNMGIMTKDITPNFQFLDESVYSNNRYMRCYGTTKEGENRPFKLLIGDLQQTSITYKYPNAEVIHYKEFNHREASPRSVVDIHANGEIIETDIYYKYLNCIGSTMCGRGQHKDTITILQALANEGRTVEYVDYWISRFADPTSKKYDYSHSHFENYILPAPLTAEKRLTIKTLKMYAKKGNRELYNKYFSDDIDFKFRKMFNIQTLITTANDQHKMMQLYFDIKNEFLILKGDQLYIYLNEQWNAMKLRDAFLLRHDVIEVFNIYIQVALDLINEAQKKNLNNEEELKKLKIIHDDIFKLNGNIKRDRYIKDVCSLLINRLFSIDNSAVEFDIGKEQHYNIHFKNGVYDLKAKRFRSRTEKDYITKWLPYDYMENVSESVMNTVEEFFIKLQPDEIQRKFTMSYLALGITGNTTKQVFKMNIGYTASNGKSTELAIHEKCFPIYTSKMDSRVLQSGFEKRHKYLFDLINNPIRLIGFEELPKGKKLDVEFLKDFVDGKRIDCEILHGTRQFIQLQSKILCVSNHDFTLDTDEGILRRGLVQKYTSRFIENVEDDTEKHIYKRVNGFEEIFENQEYKNAYFHLIRKYVDSFQVPTSASEDFIQTANESDTVMQTLTDVFEITGNINDLMSKAEFCSAIGISTDKHSKKEFDEYMNRLKSKGCSYNSQKEIQKDGKKIKGWIQGIKFIPQEE